MSPLDKRKKEVELMRVKVAREELVLKIEEKLDEIERLKAHIKVQDEAQEKLEKMLKEQ